MNAMANSQAASEEVKPEPITPQKIIRETNCHGPTGHVGAAVAASIVKNLEAAGFVIVKAAR
jgi:hypothetical protein